MGLIIGKQGIPMMIVGFPTVSDKYNITGGTLAGTTPVKFGDLVKFSATKGYYEAITGAVTVDKIAGFVLGTNVKLNELWPEGQVQVNPGEAFNLVLPNSYLAVELDSAAKESEVLANAPVAVVLATGKLTSKVVTGTAPALPGVVFTGLVEKHGETLVAEILVK